MVDHSSMLDGSRRDSSILDDEMGLMGASAALGRSGVQTPVMCHSRCVVWLMMGFVCVCSKFLGVRHRHGQRSYGMGLETPVVS